MMPETAALETYLGHAWVDPAVFALRPDYRALLRRAESGLPRVNRLTDLYNAISVCHQLPIGGEDLARYVGPPRPIRATGSEPFDTVADLLAALGPDVRVAQRLITADVPPSGYRS